MFVPPVAALESRIAWRNEPGPLSAVLVTRKVERRVRSSIHSRRGLDRRQPEQGQSTCRRRLYSLGVFRMVVMVKFQTKGNSAL